MKRASSVFREFEKTNEPAGYARFVRWLKMRNRINTRVPRTGKEPTKFVFQQ